MSTAAAPQLGRDRTVGARQGHGGRTAIAAVPDADWTSGDWVEVERVRLARVVRLEDYRQQRAATQRAVFRHRRWGVLLGVLVVALLFALTAGGGLAGADLQDPVAGQAVVEPGETLWDVAVANAPRDVDARAYLERIRELNALPSAEVPAWTVVLLPGS